MSRPRIFLSSTCFDLEDVRAALAAHLEMLGHEPLRSESHTFGVAPRQHSHDACLQRVDDSDYLILIIGGRHGGTYVGSEKSITNEEYKRAIKSGIPRMIFLKKDVATAEEIYKKNPQADLSSFVDDKRLFDFIRRVRSESEDNWIKLFDTVEDIKEAVTAQFAYYALLYSKMLREPKPKRQREGARSVVPFPTETALVARLLGADAAPDIVSGLRSLHAVIRDINAAEATGKREKLKVLWLLGRYGSLTGDEQYLQMSEFRFKQFAWSRPKGERVFEQMKDFRVDGWFDDLSSEDEPRASQVNIMFSEDRDGLVAVALKHYVTWLLKRASDDDDSALERFSAADMTFIKDADALR